MDSPKETRVGHLVIGRKVGERVVIGGGIVLVVLEVTPGKVRLGIQAPEEVSIHRGEVHDQIRREAKS